ncbi:MAG: ribonuclease HII [Bifidobacteriaceae bacterium]|jgi:ribonuclease HII|nr:ribonuclease HII [Bifidobacteriaceae bacterium]MCI1914320.1 ribonuclease HII [Bifidobacteriaceae bacterium]
MSVVAHIVPTLNLERSLFDAGADVVVGFDEVGRGALAGPVMVGAAALRRSQASTRTLSVMDLVPHGLADSKMLTEKRREALFTPLQQWVAAWGVGAATNHEIDQWGISHALGVAALRALAQVEEKLRQAAEGGIFVEDSAPAISGILDGPNDYISKNVSTFDSPALRIIPTMTTQIKADQTCASVAAASVLAKVTRDRLMEELGTRREYAPYGWVKNKGYGSVAHRAAIAARGPSDMHRVSWHLV